MTNGGNSQNNSVIIPAENEDDHVENGFDSSSVHNHEVIHTSDESEVEEELIEEEVGMSLQEFIEHVRVKGRRGLHEEYAEIKARAPSGTFNHARSLENAAKNRLVFSSS